MIYVQHLLGVGHLEELAEVVRVDAEEETVEVVEEPKAEEAKADEPAEEATVEVIEEPKQLGSGPPAPSDRTPAQTSFDTAPASAPPSDEPEPESEQESPASTTQELVESSEDEVGGDDDEAGSVRQRLERSLQLRLLTTASTSKRFSPTSPKTASSRAFPKLAKGLSRVPAPSSFPNGATKISFAWSE